MEHWSCSSCERWGCRDEVSGSMRTCAESGRIVPADHTACSNFSKALHSCTLEEAINRGLIPQPMTL